jgi:hypothetical protein
VLALDFDEGLVPVPDLVDPDAGLALSLSCVSSFGVVDEPPVWAPPLLLTITPEPTSVLDDVDPDVGDVPGVPDAPDLDGDPVAPEPAAASVVPVVPVIPAVPAVAAPAPDVPPGELEEPDEVDPLDELDDDELADPLAVSATATPWPVATAVTSQAAIARPP